MKDRSFYFYITLSGCTHLVLTLVFAFTNLNWSFFLKKKTPIASIRIDTIGLPELEKLKSRHKKKVNEKAISLKKKQAAPPKKKPKPVTQKKDTASKDSSKKKPKIGNKLSEGAEEGEALNEEQNAAINIYLTLIIGKIKLNWNLPKYLSDGNHFAQLEVQINEQGAVTYKQIVVSSNNEVFDSQVLKAIENSTPFPSPPTSVQKFIADGIVFGLSSKN
ncbi:MAG: energy transducer TonB [Bdellovibrionales bacterium]